MDANMQSTYYCWVRAVRIDRDSILPSQRVLVDSCPPSGPLHKLNPGRPPKSQIAATLDAGSGEPAGPLAWLQFGPELKAYPSGIVLDFGPAFDVWESARDFPTTPEGQVWVEEAEDYALLALEACGVDRRRKQIGTWSKDGSKHPKIGPQFDPDWWAVEFADLHDAKIELPLLDFDALESVRLTDAESDFDSRAQQEIAVLKSRQDRRTPADARACLEQARGLEQVVWPIFESSLADLDKARSVDGRAFIVQVCANIEKAVFLQKRMYMRPRPAQVDATGTLEPLFPRPEPGPGKPGRRLYPGHPSYPSGHSTLAHAWANIIQRLGRHTADTRVIARRLAENRELAGVHYPSDTAAGEELARLIVDQWIDLAGNVLNSDFVAGLKAAGLTP